ncbi:MAG: hypothetical protein HY865_22490 [Chloroflexi bacterium]|nr:hypothetical protein [Chloroflexota bacterium]
MNDYDNYQEMQDFDAEQEAIANANAQGEAEAQAMNEQAEAEENDKQPVFEELRTYKPDYEDLHNHSLYWKLENAKEIMSQFKVILKKYFDRNMEELKTRKISKLEAELEKLKGMGNN